MYILHVHNSDSECVLCHKITKDNFIQLTIMKVPHVGVVEISYLPGHLLSLILEQTMH